MIPVFSAEYLGDNIWSVKKTCPISPAADNYWFYYEDTGKLLGSEIESVTADDALYRSIMNYTRKAYSTTIELKRFDWSSASVLHLVPKGHEASSGTDAAVGLLPSPDFVNPLLPQIDKCHAMAIKALAENYYTGINTPDNNTAKVSAAKWWKVYYHLQWEISKAEKEVETLKLNAKIMFDEANNYLASDSTPDNMIYIRTFQTSTATYIDRLEQVSMYLEQAREAGWKLRCNILY